MKKLIGYTTETTIYDSPRTQVYRAYDQKRDRPVILKILKESHATPYRVAEFKREYGILQTLNAAGIISAYDILFHDNQWVMVAEDFGGKSLSGWLDSEKFSLETFFHIALAMCDILGDVHQANVIHKDLNPANILYDKETQQVKLIDFGISTTLSRENPTFFNPYGLEGMLNYICPEQTGRMNRAIDYRSDFYTLGATFYHMITGRLPFIEDDALALIHAHLTLNPIPPHQIRLEIPSLLSNIILKLMAKNAEDRYQSTYGLRQDLEYCYQLWQSSTADSLFELGQQDVPTQFTPLQKLYGRAPQIEQLLAAFSQSRMGEGVLALVTGQAGVGKSVLVQEIYKSITAHRGYYISGKFDQLQNVPYAALLQALQELLTQILTEPEVNMMQWRAKLSQALGANGQLMVDVLPDLETIIGKQSAVPELPVSEAQNRFKLTLFKFIEIFATSEHPLVMFLDDLQWADGASLALVQALLASTSSQHLLIVAAYRQNEINEIHPLTFALQEIEKGNTPVYKINLQPWLLADVQELLVDALATTAEVVLPLAKSVLQKTNGNPFFLTEFLKTLYHESLLSFDPQGGVWTWDMQAIEKRDVTDNVVTLIIDKLHQLPAETQKIIQTAACMGNKFDLRTLAKVSAQRPFSSAQQLWPAIEEGLLFPLEDSYKMVSTMAIGADITDTTQIAVDETINPQYQFAHDRIQQACYSLLPATERTAIHYQIGQEWLTQSDDESLDADIFSIVNHLNLGQELITEPKTQMQLVDLNQMAGQKAKQATAFAPSFAYWQAAWTYLQMYHGGKDAAWTAVYADTFAIHCELLELAFVSGYMDQVPQLTDIMVTRAENIADKARIYNINANYYLALSKRQESIEVGLALLAEIDLHIPAEPTFQDVFLMGQEVYALWSGKEVASFIDLPMMSDPTALVAMKIVAIVGSSAFGASPELYSLCALHSTKLLLTHGNTPRDAAIYNAYGVNLCSYVGDIASGYRFGKLALALADKEGDVGVQVLTHGLFNFMVRYWQEPLRATLKPLRDVYQTSLEVGALTTAGLFGYQHTLLTYWSGVSLLELEQEVTDYIASFLQTNQQMYLSGLQMQMEVVQSLLGNTADPIALQGTHYNGEHMLPIHFQMEDMYSVCYYHLHAMILAYLFADYNKAMIHADQVEQFNFALFGTASLQIFHYYDSLVRLANYATSDDEAKAAILTKVEDNQEKLQGWAMHAHMNLQHKHDLVAAEKHYALGEFAQARDLYDVAIDRARANSYLNDVAVANERASIYYNKRGMERNARHYLEDAYIAYRNWGATAKVKQLQQIYPQALRAISQKGKGTGTTLSTRTATSTSSTSQVYGNSLDLTSVLKAAQALSSEIVLETLLSKTMQIMLENAGAKQGVLILVIDGQLVIQGYADAVQNVITVLQAEPLNDQVVPLGLLNYIIRTQKPVVLNNAVSEGDFTQDSYIQTHQVQSALGMPLLNQGELVGVVYMENNTMHGAFTADRLEVLKVLSTQAAIAIENATLYTNIQSLNVAYERFVPKQFLAFLEKKRIIDVALGDQVQRSMSILFSDVRQFTALSEQMTPAENFQFVNQFLGYMEPAITRYGGVIDKYIGDAIMALYPAAADDALQGAIGMLAQLRQFNAQRSRLNLSPIGIGIGIHTGSLMIGTVGSATRMDSTVIGDAVNIASRIENATKIYGVPLLITADTYHSLEYPTRYSLRKIDHVSVKGKTGMVTIYEVYGHENPEKVALMQAQKEEFLQGVDAYHAKDYATAARIFRQLQIENPDDVVLALYVTRCQEIDGVI